MADLLVVSLDELQQLKGCLTIVHESREVAHHPGEREDHLPEHS